MESNQSHTEAFEHLNELRESNFFCDAVLRLEDGGVFRVSKHPYVTENEECKPVISETLKFLDDVKSLSKDDNEYVTPAIASPRNRRDILFAIGGYCDEDPTDVIEDYDSRADRWTVVSCTHLYSYRALLNDASEKK
ncbi:Kelch-like protein 10 [Zootermopsis nevadensis]|uniref:Kelch-like protein 10 n=1 Tax=Zootermopsis nevadensis TaxID=136037 RepID=A0A067QH22_ZOONE|nr:Kelch-like protein 10 [Zootermopsis nevadensis]